MRLEQIYGDYRLPAVYWCFIANRLTKELMMYQQMTSARVNQIEIVVLFTAFIGAAYGFGLYLFPAMVESIRTDIDFSYGTMGLISGSVQAGFLISSALAGFLTLRFGAINLILFPIIVCALSLGGLIYANSVLVLGGILLVLGACASLIWVPMVEVSRDVIAPKNRGKAMGLMSSGTSYGVFSTPCYWPWCCLTTAGARFGR